MGADEPATVAMGDLCWTAIEAAMAAGYDTVLVPLGATEQHGPHLPISTDTRLATALATRVAERLGGTLVAPTLPIGPSAEHMSFPGTMSIGAEAVRHVLRDSVDSLGAHGFERVVLFPGHGGWFPVLGSLYPELAPETECDLFAITGLQWYMDLLEEGLDQAGLDVDEPTVHAGASETAMMLAVDPDLVSDEDPPPGHTGQVSPARLFAEGVEAYDENGILGDPRPATADAGEHLIEHVTAAYADFLRAEFEAVAGSAPD